ncbi:hypothetical protein [Nostoc sp.]
MNLTIEISGVLTYGQTFAQRLAEKLRGKEKKFNDSPLKINGTDH